MSIIIMQAIFKCFSPIQYVLNIIRPSLKWSKKDGFSRQGFSQTYYTSLLARSSTKIISGQYATRLGSDQVSSVKFDSSLEFKLEIHHFSRKPEKLWFSEMVIVPRSYFEMVGEGWIF